MNYVFLFSGQGAQFKGMAQDICTKYFAAKNCINIISEITGEDIASLLWETDDALLARSDKNQLAITAVSQAIMAVLTEKNIKPSAAAGFSLGEFSALYAAGVLDFKPMIQLVQKRGRIMQKTSDSLAAKNQSDPSGMAAVINLPSEKIQELLKPYSNPKDGIVFAANMNSSVQTVIAGTGEGLRIAEKLCKEAGAKRVLRLPVAGPFHSPLMQDAANELSDILQSLEFKNPKIPLFSNVTGKQILSGEEAKKNTLLHITHPVLWTKEEAEIADFMQREKNKDKNDFTLIEIGPGSTLSGLWKNSEHIDAWGACLPSGNLEYLDAIL